MPAYSLLKQKQLQLAQASFRKNQTPGQATEDMQHSHAPQTTFANQGQENSRKLEAKQGVHISTGIRISA